MAENINCLYYQYLCPFTMFSFLPQRPPPVHPVRCWPGRLRSGPPGSGLPPGAHHGKVNGIGDVLVVLVSTWLVLQVVWINNTLGYEERAREPSREPWNVGPPSHEEFRTEQGLRIKIFIPRQTLIWSGRLDNPEDGWEIFCDSFEAYHKW